MTVHLPGRPVISDACRQRIAELIADWPPLSDDQRALIRTEIRAGRRLHRTTQQRDDAA